MDRMSITGRWQWWRRTHFIMISVAGEVNMVDPHIGRCLDTDSITSGKKNLGNFDIANDDIRFTEDIEPNANKGYRCQMDNAWRKSGTHKTLPLRWLSYWNRSGRQYCQWWFLRMVNSWKELKRPWDTRNNDDLCGTTLDGRSQPVKGCDCNRGGSRATCCTRTKLVCTRSERKYNYTRRRVSHNRR